MNITLERPFAATDKGKRKNNEDFLYPLPELASAGQRLFIVCDGVGGAQKGEVASSLACESFQTYFDTFLEDGDPTEEFINKAVRYTESRFDEYISRHPDAFGMATTLTLLYIGASGVTTAYIGDSRIYQFRDGKVVYRTDDHSLVNSYVKLGLINEEEAFVHPQKNIITRAITGTYQSVNADVKLLNDIRPNDTFLICTDGLTECYTDEELEKIFSSTGRSAETIKDTIVEHCIDAARDNFSFYIIPIRDIQKNGGNKHFLFSFLYSFA